MHKPYFIGITGGSGSGKTHLIEGLKRKIVDPLSVFSLDNYYLAFEDQPTDDNGKRNFDLPDSLDTSRLFEDLKKLSQGQRINVKEYNFNFRDQPSRDIKIDPNPIVIVEGLLTLFFKEIKDLLDVRIFIDAPEHLMLKRRILRDDKERGYNDLGETLYRFEHHVMPAYRKYILPYKSEVDLIIPNSGTVDKSLDVLCGFIQHKFETLTQDK